MFLVSIARFTVGADRRPIAGAIRYEQSLSKLSEGLWAMPAEADY
jgi:hypothetical protein